MQCLFMIQISNTCVKELFYFSNSHLFFLLWRWPISRIVWDCMEEKWLFVDLVAGFWYMAVLVYGYTPVKENEASSRAGKPIWSTRYGNQAAATGFSTESGKTLPSNSLEYLLGWSLSLHIKGTDWSKKPFYLLVLTHAPRLWLLTMDWRTR